MAGRKEERRKGRRRKEEEERKRKEEEERKRKEEERKRKGLRSGCFCGWNEHQVVLLHNVLNVGMIGKML